MESRIEHALRVKEQLEREEDGLKGFRKTVRKENSRKSPLDYMAPMRIGGRPAPGGRPKSPGRPKKEKD